MKIKDRIKHLAFLNIKHWIVLIVLVSVLGVWGLPRIIDGFSSIETNTCKCYEKSKYKVRVGATCNDGWRSNATGRGACSHHGGVNEWVYKDAYSKTWEECKYYAKRRSWIE